MRVQAAELQDAVYKQCLGVPKSTPNLLAFVEMAGTRCRCSGWLVRCASGWNKLAVSPRSLLGGTFVANVAGSLGCGRRVEHLA